MGAISLAVAAVLGPSAYADSHWTSPGNGGKGNQSQQSGGQNGQNGQKDKDKGKGKGADDQGWESDDDHGDPNSGESGAATNGGGLLPADSGVAYDLLKPTAPPVTYYELPFPCNEVWTGTSRPGHSPSPRSIDFNAADDLGRPVVAAAGGTVVTAVVGLKRPSYGQYVVIDHGNGESSLYGHLNSVQVSVGQVVSAGTPIGTLGSTGNSSGPHLHFEERILGDVVDAWFHGGPYTMGTAATSMNCGNVAIPDIPLAGNFYGDRPAEIAVFRRGNPATFRVTRGEAKSEKIISFGGTTDQPFVGDWDGDGKVNVGVRTPTSRIFELRVRGKDTTIKFGKSSDTPVAGNWDGVSGWEIGVRRSGSAKFLLRAADGSKTKIPLGDSDDIPVTGDWNGDGVTDLGVFDSLTATFTLRTIDPAGTELITTVPFGTPGIAGVVPIAADWDGNGVTDLGTWNPVSQTFYQRNAATPSTAKHKVGRTAYRGR